MHWTAKNIVYGRAFLNTLLAALGAAPEDPLIDTAKVRLSGNPDFAPTPDSVPGDFTDDELDYTGYAAGGIAFTVGAPIVLGSTAVGIQTPVTFRATSADPFVPGTACGWWMDDGTNVLAAEVFPLANRLTFGQTGDYLQLDVVLPLTLALVTGL